MSNTVVVVPPIQNNITISTDETSVNVTSTTSKVVQVSTAGPQGPATTVYSIITLTPVHPLPTSPATGTLAVSASSPPKPYFYDGASWNPLY